jgi:E1A-binding protein p400
LEKLRLESELPLDDLLKDYHLDSNYFTTTKSTTTEATTTTTAAVVTSDDDEDDVDEASTSSANYFSIDDEEESIDDNDSVDLAKILDTNNTENLGKTKTTNVDEDEQERALASIAEQAQSLQPTGYTLETTNVTTPLPTLLLKHQLREYQHVGLDWLVTMYENKLNGILADEMGLGKTIQTIALFAHLAESKSIWGPHLIVVPTSVILNWELEFKKWAPGFKILTYYGSQRERKMKRQGWSKPNAFHVCITSYKLVVQDHSSFRRKKWKYFVLDEAHHIKNFKSQRWQSLLNFQSQRRLVFIFN